MVELPLENPGTPDVRSPARFLAWIARGQLPTLTSGSLFGILWMVSQAMIPLVIGAGLGAMIRRDRPQIVSWSLVILGLGLLQAAAGILRHRRAVANFLICATRIQQLVVRRATENGGGLARLVAAGEVANVGASDIERVGDALDVVARFAGGVVSYAVVAVVLLVASPPLGAIVVAGVPVAVLAVAPILRPYERRQTTERDSRTEASSVASDTVAGLRVLRGLGGEQVFADRYRRASEDVAHTSAKSADLRALLDGTQVLLPGAIVVAVTYVGAHLAVGGTLSAGELVAFYASAAFLVLPMQTFVEAANKWTAATVAARRILGILAVKEASPRPEGEARIEVAPRGALYDKRTGVEIPEGLFTVVVPASSEEGTALLERLARFDDGSEPDSVRFGGVRVETIPLDWYRRHVVLLERSQLHLKGTLRELLFLPEDAVVPGPEAQSLLAAACVEETIEALGAGLDSLLPEKWRTISGGQRQRLSLAQVLLLSPDVLLLDDPTSAVDAHTEAAIAGGVRERRAGRTTVVATTSPLVIERADSVVLLAGRAVASGSHAELLASEPLYYDVVMRGAVS